MSTLPPSGVHAYRHTQVTSRTPLELVVMLYDGALAFIAQAEQAMERGDIPARRDAISRAMAVISELQSTLNLDKGGEIAGQLDGLYTFVNLRLLDATSRKDVKPLREARKVFETLRGAWAEIAKAA